MRNTMSAEKKSWRVPILLLLLLACAMFFAILPATAQAQDGTAGNVDGVWSNPRSDLGVTPVTCQDINNSLDDPTNENVMRYGQQLGAVDCGPLIFRSGFGFDGADVVTFTPGAPFLLGQFTHYNESIVTPLVPMQFVDLTIDLQSEDPALEVQMSYTMQLDETINDGSCPYGASSANLCDDRVDFVNNTPSQTIVVDGVSYTLNILGFVPGTMDSCQYDANLVDYFITAELERNDACIFAEFLVPQPAITIEKSPDLQEVFIADYAEFTITVTNAGNVGFNQALVADPLTPDCDRTFDALKAGASESYVCTAYDIMEDFDNVATVTAVFDGNAYMAEDSARIDVQAPDTASYYAVKYHDQNSNGQRDVGEPGLYGWTLCTQDADGANVGFCQVTDPNGYATLAPNEAGEFLLCEEPQPGWINTDPGDGTACKPFAITEAPLYVEFYPTVNDIYGAELTEKSPDQRQWTYAVYQYFGSQNLHDWTLGLPSCIGEAQIDAAATTPGWSFVNDPAAGIHGIQWQTPGGVDPIMGAQFTLALMQAYPTGAASASIGITAPPSPAATDAIAGPACHEIVWIGNNTELPAGGQLEVRKLVLPADDSGYFNLAIDGIVYATDVRNGGVTGKQTVPAGVHTVGEGGGSQTDLDDYLRSLSCTEMNSGATWTPGVTGEVNVDVGDDVVCTFTNIRRGAIRIVKQVVGSAGADWTFNGSWLGAFMLPAAGGQQDFVQLAPGTYTVAEAAIAGWSLAGLACTDPDNGTAIDLATRSAAIDLDPGETVVCTFNNVADAGRLTIVKQVNGASDAAWSFTSALGDFTLPAAGGAQRFDAVAPGVYNVLEVAKEGWHVAAITCNDPDGETVVDIVAGSAAVDIDANEEIVCTFINEPGRPAVALDKNVTHPIAYPNQVITYTFAVANPGQVPLHNVRVADDQCTVLPVLSSDFNAGDADQDNALDVDEMWGFLCTTALAADTTNIATVFAEAPWGEAVWSTDSVAVDVIAPQMALEKLADREVVHAGDTVNYQIVVRNTGDTPLYNVVVEDSIDACELAGPSGDNGNAALEPGEVWLYTCALVIIEDTVNLASVTGNDVLGNPWYAEDRMTVEVYAPAIEIIKVADRAFAYPNDAINFTVKVRNIGNTPLNTIDVTDALPQCTLSGLTGDDGDNQLAVGEVWTYTCGLTVCPGEAAVDGNGEVSSSAVTTGIAQVWNLGSTEPELAPACVDPLPTLVGPSFGSCWSVANQWFELTVVNKASIPAYIGYDIYRVADSFRNLGRFDVGQRSVFTVVEEGTLRKYISANGLDNWQQLGGTHTLNIAEHISRGYLCEDPTPEPPTPTPPATPTPEPPAPAGVCVGDCYSIELVSNTYDTQRNITTVTWRITNVCNRALSYAAFELPAGIIAMSPADGGRYTSPSGRAYNVENPTNNPFYSIKFETIGEGIKDGESELFSYTLPGGFDPNTTMRVKVKGGQLYDLLVFPPSECTIPNPVTPEPTPVPPLCSDVTNVAKVTAKDGAGREVGDSDSAFVALIHPGIKVEKSVDKSQIAPGEEVNFTISVKNPGDVALTDFTIEESLPECALAMASGDNGNGIFEPLETWVYTCSMRPMDDVTNVVRASGRDPLGRLWSDEASASVDVVKPALALVKEADKHAVYPGESVHFTLRVRNQGNVQLSQVKVTDSMSQCNLSRPSGDNGNRRLDPGEEWVYTCRVTFCPGEHVTPNGGVDEVGAACHPSPSPGVCKDVTNIGNVTAKDPRGKTLSASDRVFIDLIRPGITVDKKVNRSVVPAGAEVNFTIKVKNSGNTPLSNITVVDEQPACALSAPTGDNGNNILDPGERWVYTCAMPITQRTTNVATATGTDILGNRWRDSDSVQVRTSCTCVTVAGVQDTEACIAAESDATSAYQIYLPMTRR